MQWAEKRAQVKTGLVESVDAATGEGGGAEGPWDAQRMIRLAVRQAVVWTGGVTLPRKSESSVTYGSPSRLCAEDSRIASTARRSTWCSAAVRNSGDVRAYTCCPRRTKGESRPVPDGPTSPSPSADVSIRSRLLLPCSLRSTLLSPCSRPPTHRLSVLPQPGSRD